MVKTIKKTQPQKSEQSVGFRKESIIEVLQNGHPDGMTAEEISMQVCPNEEQVLCALKLIRPRLSELRQAGFIIAAGRKKSELTGRNIIVWRMTKSAQVHLLGMRSAV